MRSGAMPEMTVLEGGPGFEIGVEESHPQPDFKRGSPLYVEFQGRRWHSASIVFGSTMASHRVQFRERRSPALLLDGKPVAMEPWARPRRATAGPLAIGDPRNGKPLKGDIGGLRIYDRSCSRRSRSARPCTSRSAPSWRWSEGKRSKDQKQRLLDYFLTYDAPAELRRVYAS